MNNSIYIIDSHAAVLEQLCDILINEPYKIKTFQDSQAAFTHCVMSPPDLLLLNINLPGLDSLSFCRKVKADSRLVHIPLIVIYGCRETEKVTEAFEAGASDSITRPFVPIEILSRIRTHMKRKGLLDQPLRLNKILALQEAKKEAEKANRAKNRFLSSINHELRTPLNGLLGMLDLMKQHPLEDEELSLYLELADCSAQYLAHLICDILDYTQLENHSMLFTYGEFSLKDFFTAAGQTHDPACREKGLTLDIQIPEEEQIFMGDRDKIAQVLNNLISNSIKYSRKGTISVRYTLQKNLKILVRDEGIGISRDEQKKIFEPYVQKNLSYSRDQQGLGLGLSISKSIIQQMGGSIHLESDQTGSEFTFSLPPHAAEYTLAPEPVQGFGKKGAEILIIEDDTVTLYFMEQILEDAGYAVSSEINGKEGLKNMLENNYDLILLDIGLPIFSGFQVFEEFKVTGSTPVLAVTAYCQEKDIRRFLKAGFKAVLPKPVDSAVLLDKVASLLTMPIPSI